MARTIEQVVTPAPGPALRPSQASPVESSASEVRLNVNGVEHLVKLEARVTLLDALREYLHLTGTKKGCDQGQCGTCTVHVNGRRALSCLTLAMMHQGDMITTIEGLSRGEELNPIQAAFIQHDGLQCGFCTPGQVMSAAGLIREGHAHTPDEIREELSGNLCRCGAYVDIVAAVQQALEARRDDTL